MKELAGFVFFVEPDPATVVLLRLNGAYVGSSMGWEDLGIPNGTRWVTTDDYERVCT